MLSALYICTFVKLRDVKSTTGVQLGFSHDWELSALRLKNLQCIVMAELPSKI